MGDDGGGGESPHRAKTGRTGDPEAAGPGGTGGAADSSRAAAAGRGGARGAGRGGRPAGLHGEDLRRVEGQLKRGPGTLGYKKWTSARVKQLIERQCRVKYDAS